VNIPSKLALVIPPAWRNLPGNILLPARHPQDEEVITSGMRNVPMEPLFRDRREAGRILAKQVISSVPDSDPLVLALPRGGVPVGFEVARALHAELDVFLVRKLGLPGQEELAIGAIASGGVRVLNRALVSELQLSRQLIDQITAREERELKRREELYRQGRPARPVRHRTVILIDDGLATGASMKAAARALRQQEPNRIVAAVPVAAPQTCEEFRTDVDQILCTYTPEPFLAVGLWYEDFSPTTDDEVQQLLREAEPQAPHPPVR
jgi:putative phosphoribosyl transferase